MNNILRSALNACSFQVPLEADDKRRVDLYGLGVRGTDRDPIRRLQAVIEGNNSYTQQFFSGYTGSGKSTELRRLAANLEGAGYTPVLVDCEEYFNLNVPPRVNDLLATTAAGVDKFIREKCPGGITAEFKSYWERFRNFLGSEVEIEGLKLKVPEVAELELKLKQDVSFRTRLYSHLEQSGRLSDFARQCHEFLEEATAIAQEVCPGKQGLVIIVDSFEKVRGDYLHAEKVRQAVETIFVRDSKWLRLPCHVIYTVPSWLTFLESGTAADIGRILILPMCRVMDQHGERVASGFEAMRQILGRRMPLGELFADMEPLDRLIEMSGGYPRDLLRMMYEVLLSAMMDDLKPPIPKDTLGKLVADVIAAQIRIYDKPIFDEDLPLLVEVAAKRDVPRAERKQAFRMAELFDNHFILGYRNGEEWYDLHPLVRRSPKVQVALREANGKKSKDRK